MSVLATTRALRVVPRLVASARFGAKVSPLRVVVDMAD